MMGTESRNKQANVSLTFMNSIYGNGGSLGEAWAAMKDPAKSPHRLLMTQSYKAKSVSSSEGRQGNKTHFFLLFFFELFLEPFLLFDLDAFLLLPLDAFLLDDFFIPFPVAFAFLVDFPFEADFFTNPFPFDADLKPGLLSQSGLASEVGESSDHSADDTEDDE